MLTYIARQAVHKPHLLNGLVHTKQGLLNGNYFNRVIDCYIKRVDNCLCCVHMGACVCVCVCVCACVCVCVCVHTRVHMCVFMSTPKGLKLLTLKTLINQLNKFYFLSAMFTQIIIIKINLRMIHMQNYSVILPSTNPHS